MNISPQLSHALSRVASFDGKQTYCPLKLFISVGTFLSAKGAAYLLYPTERIIGPATVTSGDRQAKHCGAEFCGRPTHAHSLCHAHYKQYLRGTFTGKKLRRGIKGKKYNGVSDHEKREVAKDALIAEMGGRCLRCNAVHSREWYDFHHLFNKKANVAERLINGDLWGACVEASKCVLLCLICHQKEHGRKGLPLRKYPLMSKRY